ncbi:hypothetical protein D910_00162 [Dendroctonus ponderosae]|uniref:Uncharacterized protein n=1 Tax=Dendroctonus ponderosae TaxID=77166 RepID=U4UNR2_DENPD|nr:hypothetical protein D910_00162 [Dendroctonus ponderosae]
METQKEKITLEHNIKESPLMP